MKTISLQGSEILDFLKLVQELGLNYKDIDFDLMLSTDSITESENELPLSALSPSDLLKRGNDKIKWKVFKNNRKKVGSSRRRNIYLSWDESTFQEKLAKVERGEPGVRGFENDFRNMMQKSTSMVFEMPSDVDKQLKKLSEEFNESLNWYSIINKLAKKLLKKNAPLFFCIMAITSANSKLNRNLRDSIDVYRSVYEHLANAPDREKLLNFIADFNAILLKLNIKRKGGESGFDANLPEIKEKLSKYSDMSYYNYAFDNKISLKFFEKINNIITKFINAGGTMSPREAISFIEASIDEFGNFSKTYDVGKYKIFSFALNLLDPSYKSEKLALFPVTIDIWMLRFFNYEHYIQDNNSLDEKEKKKLQKAFEEKDIYFAYAKKIQEFAVNHGIKPTHMQAIVWTAMIKKVSPGSSSSSLKDSFRSAIKILNKNQEKQKDIYRIFNIILNNLP